MEFSKEENNLLNYMSSKIDKHSKKTNLSCHLFEDNIINAYRHCFTSSKEKIHYLNNECVLNQVSTNKFMNGVCELAFGIFYSQSGLWNELENSGLESDKISIKIKSIVVTIGVTFESFLINKRQRDKIQLDYNMFSDETILVIKKHKIVRVSHHVPFQVKELTEGEELIFNKVVSDYLEHLPVIPELLKLGTASKFSTNARYAYVWIKMLSGGGKGFFINRLKVLGIAVSFSMEELEAVLRGKPSGKKQEDFDDLWFFIGDEVKHVKREMKELDSEMSLSSKFGFEFSVRLPAKILLSAEDIPTLTDGGVEDQFVERLSGLILNTKVKLGDRAVFKEVGNNVYEQYIERYFSITLNKHVQEYRAMGKEKAQGQAYQDMVLFHDKYKIDKKFGSQKEEVKNIAEEVKEIFSHGKLFFKGREKSIKKTPIWRKGSETDDTQKKGIFIQNRDALNYINDYIVENYPHTSGKFIPKKNTILMMIDETGREEAGVVKCGLNKKDEQVGKRGIIIYDKEKPKHDKGR